MAKLGFHFDMTACIGCKTCQIACSDIKDLKVAELFREVRTFEGGRFPNPWIYFLSMSCNHCEDPKCANSCPTGSLYKREDGIVAQDKDKCIGCTYCAWSCPYNAIQYIEEEGIIGKCDLCADLIDKGENPACVDACIMRVLHYGDMEELKAEYADGVKDIAVLPSSSITGPSVLITAKEIARRGA